MQLDNIVLTIPDLRKPGGVASFYNAVLPFLENNNNIKVLQIGSTNNKRSSIRKYFADVIGFYQSLSDAVSLVHVNPSLGFKSFLRDGLFVILSKYKQKPVIVFFHGWNKQFEHYTSKYLRFLFHLSFGRANAFIVLASEFETSLRNLDIHAPIYIETTAINENLIQDFDIEKKVESLSSANEIRILFLSRLEREKGAFETIDAIKLLINQGFPVTLSIAGNGPILDDLKQYAVDLGLPSQSVKFLGYVTGEDKIRAFSEHHIYCFPTNYGEGLPTSVLEAMVFGLPVVTRPVGGLADQFKDDIMGKLCHTMDPDEIAQAIQSLIMNKSSLTTIARYNHQHALDNFMASIVAKRLNTIYQSTLNN